MSPAFASPARGDRAFERLYRRHAADVYRYAYAVLQNRADAEDVTQTAFMNAYRALERGERPERPHNWLIAITHNVCRQRFRQSQRRPSEVEWQDDLPDQLVADDEGPTADDIRRALGHLPFNQRAALVMRELEGRSYAEIADVLGVTTAAVETLIFRARRALREQLEGSLTCGEAELAISRQLDGRLSRAEKGQLRAHLRECPECSSFARRQRAQRTALRSLGSIPLPASLASLFGGGGAPATAVAAKTIAVAAAAALAGGAGYEAARDVVRPHPLKHAVTASAPARTTAAPVAAVVVPLPRPAASPSVHEQGRVHRTALPTRRIERRGRSDHAAIRHEHGRGHGRGSAQHGPPSTPAAGAQPVTHPGAASRGVGRGHELHAQPHARVDHATPPGRSATHHGSSGATPAAHETGGNGHSGSHDHGSSTPAGGAPAGNGSNATPAEPSSPAAPSPPGRSDGPPPGKHGASFSP